MEPQSSHKPFLNKFFILIFVTLLTGLVGAVVALQQRQNERSRADTSSAVTIWPLNAAPAELAQDDSDPVEVGVKFRPLKPGVITGMRFYKLASSTGTHIGNLWNATGTKLATATFTNETASGWQSVTFPAPVAVNGNETYVASYFAPHGQYAYSGDYFTNSVTNAEGSLIAPSNAEAGNGVYTYASSSAFPKSTYKSSNYWVDVFFVENIATNDSSCTTVTVPGTSDPWLAGMPDGATASQYDQSLPPDIAPAQSPIFINLSLTPGKKITFKNISGLVAQGPGYPLLTADGGGMRMHLTGAENGIANVSSPVNSLVGVFLDSGVPSVSSAPAALDFGLPGSEDYTTLAPLLKQPFFIGDGKNSSGSAQEITVPKGATRLYLGTMDGHQWSNNKGSFLVDACRVADPTPTSAPTATPTPTSTPTHIPTLTPTQIPTLTPAPTATSTATLAPTPAEATIEFNLLLHGLGLAGDSTSPNTKANLRPRHKLRTAKVEIYDQANAFIASKEAQIVYASASGSFISRITVPVPSGLYTIKVKANQYLRGLFSGIQTLTVGQTTKLPTLSLVVGDINEDNKLNIIDYNILMGCYSDLLPAVSCTSTNKGPSDLNDDGRVNQYDYNLFLRELQNQPGQ